LLEWCVAGSRKRQPQVDAASGRLTHNKKAFLSRVGGTGRHSGLKENSSARREIGDAELLKFGQT
jgi:hypothetical protein